jgi:hypothetical protein
VSFPRDCERKLAKHQAVPHRDQFLFGSLFLFEFLFGRSLIICLAVFPRAAFFGELPFRLFLTVLAGRLGTTEPTWLFSPTAAFFTDFTVCGDTNDFPFAALVPITVPATAPTTAPTGPAMALPTTAPATPPAVCLDTGRFSSGTAFDFFVAIK